MPSWSSSALAPATAPGRAEPRPEIASHPRKPRGPAYWPALVFVLLSGAAAAYWIRLARTPVPASPAASVRTVLARRGTVRSTLRVTGVTAAPNSRLLLAPQMRGWRGAAAHHFSLILRSVVPGGSTVRQGDVIAEFDRQYMENRLSDYRALVVNHEANLRKLRALLDVRRAQHRLMLRRAKGTMEKAELDLRKAPVLSAIKGEDLLLLRNEARARYDELLKQVPLVDASEMAAIRSSEADLRVSRLEFERAQRNLERMVVRAPMDGMVVLQTIHRGSEHAQIEAGDQLHSGQPFVQLVNRRALAVEAQANQVDSELLRTGMPAVVRFDAFPGLELPARVESVGTLARSAGWRVNYVRSIPLRLALLVTDPRVIPDLTASADLVLATAENAVLAPRAAVFYTAEGDPFVVVKDEKGWDRRDVEVQLASNVDVALGDGVEAGEVLAAEWSPELSAAQ